MTVALVWEDYYEYVVVARMLQKASIFHGEMAGNRPTLLSYLQALVSRVLVEVTGLSRNFRKCKVSSGCWDVARSSGSS